ncbi:MAG: 16S rRNA (uracil(1498)-N(3))-methyltransferase [Lachnospiraceae bacterium]|nr:16S rRNA (uracil(1498)-N(3))-methyltransferase [Lachnospiraceae bacterium]
MYQFFVEPSRIQGTRVVITGNDVNHIKNVLRMQPGEEIAVSNGEDGKEYRCGIEELYEDEIICTLRFVKEDGVELPSKIYLFQGLPKADKMELIVQKAVELGIHEIIPVSTKRAVVKLDEKKAKSKIARWQTISEAAAKQSKRRIVPQIHTVMSFKEAVAYAKDMQIKLIPYELAEGMEKTREIIGSLKPGQDIAIFIGPEGGFEENEIQTALDNGIEPITLGKRILRTETAGFTILSWIMYQLEGMGI